jgi:hypothetical protein
MHLRLSEQYNSIYLCIYLSVSLFICLSVCVWLYSPFVVSWPLFQFLDRVHSRLNSLAGGSADHKASTYTQNKRAHTHIHASSGIRTHDPSFRGSEDSSCHRPRGHYDRQLCTVHFGLHCIQNPTGKNTTIFLILDTHSHVVMLCFFFPAGLVLNEFIRHFEPAVYDRDALMTQHKRLRRGVTSASQPLSLHIKTNSR